MIEIKGIKAVSAKGNASVSFRNVASKDPMDKISGGLEAAGMQKVANQEYVMQYKDEDGNIMYGDLVVTFTMRAPEHLSAPVAKKKIQYSFGTEPFDHDVEEEYDEDDDGYDDGLTSEQRAIKMEEFVRAHTDANGNFINPSAE